jgi:membrane-bound lytic murein transglycosylase B
MFEIAGSTPLRFINIAKALILVMLAGLVSPTISLGSSADFVRGLWPEAQSAGVSRQAFDAAFAGYNPIPQVIELTRKQPEFTQTVQQYIDKRVTGGQASKGQAMRGEWAQTLAGARQRYGVQAEIVLAIWGWKLILAASWAVTTPSMRWQR